MTRKKKPQSLKVIAGTDRADREAAQVLDLPNVSEIPEPPTWLPNPHAVKYYWATAKTLHANGLLTELCIGPLQILCALYGNLVQLNAAGLTPPASLLAQYRAFINDFGMSPTSLRNVRPADGEKKPTGFAKNRRA